MIRKADELAASKVKSSFDVVGLEIGMSLTQAERIVREHMTPTSEYSIEKSGEMTPFRRSVVYVRIEDRLAVW